MELINIGYIIDTHGLKGEVKVGFTTDQIELYFKAGNKIYIEGTDQKVGEYTIESFYMIPKGMGLMKIQDILTIDQALPLRKKTLMAERKEIEGRIYLADLLHYKVYDAEGKEYGEITDITRAGARNYLMIGEKYLPYVPDSIIVAIDKIKKVIIVSEEGKDILANA